MIRKTVVKTSHTSLFSIRRKASMKYSGVIMEMYVYVPGD